MDIAGAASPHASLRRQLAADAAQGRAPQYGSIPLIAPQPPRLSRHSRELAEIEASGVFSNYGPVNSALEDDLIQGIFGEGACVTVCNATIGLMLAIRQVIDENNGVNRSGKRRYALMPSFTFAATAHAALWCGLTPLLCDIDPLTWLPDAEHEKELLRRYEGEIAVIVPYATFGNNLDLGRYEALAAEHGVPVVVDAAASLGSMPAPEIAFGTGFPWPVVFSMHATKAFSVGEGGLIYCSDHARIERLRRMGSFGFAEDRTAHSLGLNSKISEVTALTARLQLPHYEAILQQKEGLARYYRAVLRPEFLTQQQEGHGQARAFQSVLLPAELASSRDRVIEALRAEGVGAGSYFSPHLAEQPYFRQHARAESLPVTADVASRIVSLPLITGMSTDQVNVVVGALHRIADQLGSLHSIRQPVSATQEASHKVRAA